ncbi:MAG: peptidoglycan DD-metalloendopeptidase family protein [Congregibacter sp.]
MIFHKKPLRGATPDPKKTARQPLIEAATAAARAATAAADERVLSRHHIMAVAAISALVALIAIVTPSGDVKANRSAVEQETSAITPDTAAIDAVIKSGEISDDIPLEVAGLLATATKESGGVDALREAPPATSSQLWEEFIVRSGDNLSLLFKRAGFSTADVYRIVHTAPQGRGLERIYPGQSLSFLRDEDGGLAAVKHTLDDLQSVIYRRMDGGFSSERSIRETELRQSWATVEIESSLFLAGKEAGMSSNFIMEVATIFGGVIDFVLDPRKGDTMEVLYEERYLDGEKYAEGNVIAASYTNRGERFDAYRYIDSEGMTSYYNEVGVSMRKAFLMAPVDFTRISSNFNPRRKHPIYKTVRPHNGTDYAAPRGTPVFAAGDGRVVKAGYSRANGNFVFVQHGDRFQTKYLHLDKSKVKEGQRVVQSQVIGTVGSTGAATGPHLHYEFLVDGRHRNPRYIHKSLPKAKSLPETEMPRFRIAIAESANQLANLRKERLLAAGSADSNTGAP